MKILAIALLLGTLVGCSSGQPQSPPQSQTSTPNSTFNLPVIQDAAYLKTLRSRYPQYNLVSDALLIETGKNICYHLNAGQSLVDVITMPVNPPLTSQMWAYNVGVAIGIYCPTHGDDIRKLQGG